MEAIFLQRLNMSITAGWLVLAVILVRLTLTRVPKALRVVLWALVGVRLILPVSFESMLSLIPSAETVPQDILYTEEPMIQSGISALNETINPILVTKLAPTVGESASPMQILTGIAANIWVVGLLLMVLYAAISYLRVGRKVREATPLAENIRLCDHISTPFILGVIRPRIYLPSTMDERDREYVVAHEKAHLKRRDHWWKPLGFLILTVYWFNPILWVAYVLFCRDIELACDEKVIREIGVERKKPYSDALINCSAPRRMITACPLAFGEVGVETRIKSVLNYKKPGFWIIVIGAIACVAVAVCFLSDPPGTSGEQAGIEGSDGPVEIPEGLAKYEFKDSVDPLPPTIRLNIDGRGKSFSFTYSVFSSYWPVGNYEVENDLLTLRTGDGRCTYVFKIEKDKLIFDASRSSQIPEYRYSGDSYETDCPVPDGAVFELVTLPEDDEVVEGPPVLNLYGWRLSQEATVGNYVWHYVEADGKVRSLEADGNTILHDAEKMIAIERDIGDYYLSSVDIFAVSLSFEIMPDEVTVLAWRQEGKEAVSEVVPLENLSFRTDFGVDVYEVIAKWNTSEYYGGEVRYGFRFPTPVVKTIP